MKELYKSRENKVFTGVIGGIGEYFGADPVLFRVAWIAVSCFTGFFPGLFAYILVSLVVPAHSEE